MTVKHILQQKGRTLWTIDPDATVFDALANMAEKDVGSLVVVDRGKIDRHHHRETLFAEGDSHGQNVPYHAG
jgi:CBS domain-containing protein